MKNNLIRVIAVIMALLVLLSVPTFAENTLGGIADLATTLTESFTDLITTTEESETTDVTDVTDETDVTDVTDITDITETTEPQLNFDEISGDTVVGKLYICTQQRGLGHAWIYVESCFNGDMPVGCYTLRPYQGVSIGTFAVTRSDGIGVYYNVEAYCGNKYGMKNKSWIGTEITKDQLLKANKEIKGWNYWDFYFNCTFFAAKVWNSVSSKKIVPIVFPFFIKWQILAKGGDKNIEMKEVAKEDCFKQKKTGNKAYLEQCSDRSLDSKLL